MEVAPALLGDLLKEPTVTVPMCLTAAAARALLQLRPASRVRRAARRLYRSLGWISTDAVRGTALCARPVPRAAEAFRPVHEFLRQPSGA